MGTLDVRSCRGGVGGGEGAWFYGSDGLVGDGRHEPGFQARLDGWVDGGEVGGSGVGLGGWKG